MGRKEPRIFDDWPDDENSGARKKSSEHDKLSWWAEFEEDRFGGSGSSQSSSSSYDSYSYRSVFDDSDTAWYRQSSFRYGSYRDYSPSSLFRSSFQVGGWAVQSSDAKNKAIRALRTLKRNANTVANAAAKITYDVQFSAGTDSNGVSAEMAAGKQQTIYVSPDTVCAAETAADEDAAVDALTGFVLLRVQLAQSVSSSVICDINETSMRGMASKIASVVQETAGKADANHVAAEVMDDYSAGVLAKSMLMRLSRRAVVEDWGGFAPYFVRHAKKLMAAKEELLKESGLSAELLASKVAYNMAAAEDEITLDAEIGAIVAKHLGEQLPVNKILPACRALMADLRAYVNSKAEKLPENSVEALLRDGLQEIMNSHAEALAENQRERDVMRDHMSEMATAMDAMFDAASEELNSPDAEKRANTLAKTDNVIADFNNEFYVERLLGALQNAQVALNGLGALTAPEQLAHVRLKTREWRANIASNMAHFQAVVSKLRAAGVDFEPAVDPVNFAEMPEVAGAVAQAAALAELNKSIQEKLTSSVGPLKDLLKNSAEAMLGTIDAALKTAETVQHEMAPLRKKLNKARKEFDSAAGPHCFAETTAKYAKDHTERLNEHRAQIKHAADSMSSRNSPSDLKAVAQMLQSIQRQGLTTGPVCESTSWSGGYGTQRFTQAGCKYNAERAAAADMPADGWHEKAIEEFLQTVGAESPQDEGGLLPHAIKEANSDLFELLMSLFKDSDGGLHVPGSTRNMDAEKLDKLNKAAESLGMTAKDLLAMLQTLTNDMANGRTSAMAKEIGELIRDELTPAAKTISPIDDALFGETVEKTTTVLDGAAITQINDESKNAVEEDYVAYLSHSDAKPTVKVKKAKKNEIASGQATVSRVISQNRGAVAKIREALQFQDTKRVGEVHGMRSGDLDEGSLHKLRYDSEHIWSQKTVSKLPDVAVGILVDQSGSMNCGRKIDQAREMCIILSEAVRKIAGVHLHIFGHTANQGSSTDLTLFEHYSSTMSAENAELGALGNIRSYSNNYDGYAIKETAKLLNNDPAQRKYLFVIADGLPHGTGYSGDEAEKHVASVCSFVRTRLKIPTYAFAVGVPFSERSSFETQYGKNNVLFLSQVSHCLPQITRFLRNALQKEKTLVGVSAD